MLFFTNFSKHDTGSLHRKTAHCPGSCTVCLILLCCCLAAPCRAENNSGSADNQTLQVTFISLKPGSTIGPSCLRLHADSSLDFSINGEPLTKTGGIWSTQTNRFSASINFSIDKQPSFHYRLELDGYLLWGLHVGRARLREYDRKERQTQEIGFLFYAAPPNFFTAQQHTKESGKQ